MKCNRITRIYSFISFVMCAFAGAGEVVMLEQTARVFHATCELELAATDATAQPTAPSRRSLATAAPRDRTGAQRPRARSRFVRRHLLKIEHTCRFRGSAGERDASPSLSRFKLHSIVFNPLARRPTKIFVVITMRSARTE